jgi:hypothetical protein
MCKKGVAWAFRGKTPKNDSKIIDAWRFLGTINIEYSDAWRFVQKHLKKTPLHGLYGQKHLKKAKN